MPIDEQILLYSLANTFKNVLNVNICEQTQNFINSKIKKFIKLTPEDKMYYANYALQLSKSLTNYLDDITLFEINTDDEHEIFHDFRLVWKKDNVAHISMSHNSINIRDIIPEKLMKICKYKKNSKIHKSFTEAYQEITDVGYQKIQNKVKYSEINEEKKNKWIIDPVCNLVTTTLTKKRKCAVHIYNYLFNESERIVFRLYKNRYTMYDFGAKLDDVEGFKMVLESNNTISITFNNCLKFVLVLQTNATEIKKHLSLKFHTKLENMDEIFAITTGTV